MKEKPKPAKFCWECGRKLRGKYVYQVEVEGYWRTVHKACGESIKHETQKEKAEVEDGEGRLLV